MGDQRVDPCLSRRVSQGHPVGEPRMFFSLCTFFFPQEGLWGLSARCTTRLWQGLPTLLEEKCNNETGIHTILCKMVYDSNRNDDDDQCCRSDKHHLHDDGICTHMHCVSLSVSMLWPLQPLLPTCDSLSQSSDKKTWFDMHNLSE